MLSGRNISQFRSDGYNIDHPCVDNSAGEYIASAAASAILWLVLMNSTPEIAKSYRLSILNNLSLN